MTISNFTQDNMQYLSMLNAKSANYIKNYVIWLNPLANYIHIDWVIVSNTNENKKMVNRKSNNFALSIYLWYYCTNSD